MQILQFLFDPDISSLTHDNQDKEGHTHHQVSTFMNYCCEGQTLARIIEAESLQDAQSRIPSHPDLRFLREYSGFAVNDSIQFDEGSNSFTARIYGFVLWNKQEKKYSIIPPVYISADAMQAWMLLSPNPAGRYPDPDSLLRTLKLSQLQLTAPPESIRHTLEQLQKNKTRLHPLLIAQGTAPLEGYPAYYELLVRQDTSIGTLQADGSIDYRSRRSFLTVQKDQPVLLYHPEKLPQDGSDVTGEVLPARTLSRDKLLPGENLAASSQDRNTWTATLDGVLSIRSGQVHIDPLLVIEGDVGYQTGHVDFSGSVLIRGAVLAGFHVKASGNIEIEKDIEDASVEAGGSLTIHMGVTGSGHTRLFAGSELQAQYIMNSEVEAMGPIRVADSIVNSTVISNHSVTVVDKHGQVIGGRIIALETIEVKIAGAAHGNDTLLETGSSLKMEVELEEIHPVQTKWQQTRDEISQKISLTFGEHMLTPTREDIELLLPAKKTELLGLLSELGNARSRLSVLDQKIQEIRDKYSYKGRPRILVQDKAWPGTVIVIKNKKYPVTTLTSFAQFYLDEDSQEVKSAPLR